jgi:hypothetical protein
MKFTSRRDWLKQSLMAAGAGVLPQVPVSRKRHGKVQIVSLVQNWKRYAVGLAIQALGVPYRDLV